MGATDGDTLALQDIHVSTTGGALELEAVWYIWDYDWRGTGAGN